MDKTKWVVNISSRSLTKIEVEVLQKGPKFEPAPSNIPYKEIVANIENLADDTKELVRNSTASILDKAQLPANNVSKYEKRALSDLKKGESIVIMKADKCNCFVVMDRSDYNLKMQALLDDKKTYDTVTKNPFGRVERELNSKLLSLKNEGKLHDDRTYRKLHSSDGLPPTIRGSVKYHKKATRCDLLSIALVQLFITPRNISQKYPPQSRTRIIILFRTLLNLPER